jgi:glycosyltransferase involved in cell wall biosynthesis
MIEGKPLVSVIIPVYNGEACLVEAIDSVLAQTYRPLELIVVDDGSVDGTADVARSYQEAAYVYQENQGHAAAKNRGISVANGQFLAFLDADDIWTPEKLQVQMDYLLEHTDVGFVICRMKILLEQGTEWPSSLNQKYYRSDPAGFLPSALVTRRCVFERIGAFDISYRHGNDSDWFFRAKDVGIAMAILPQVLLRRRIHANNLSHETQSMTSELLRLVRASIGRRQDQSSRKGMR